jgi:hypothetical protein
MLQMTLKCCLPRRKVIAHNIWRGTTNLFLLWACNYACFFPVACSSYFLCSVYTSQVDCFNLIAQSVSTRFTWISASLWCWLYFTECNYMNGKWVSDSRRPLYSGFGCKQWLSESWSCRLTQRTDFAYEKFRWQPEACDMPEFEASQFLKRYLVIASPRLICI